MKNWIGYVLFQVLLVFIFCIHAKANNIQVSNVVLTEQNISAGTNNVANYTKVQFNISWENSWRVSTDPLKNWDAAWVFVKYRVNSGNWQHASLNNTGHTAPAGSTIDVGLLNTGSVFDAATNPAVGVFIYRSTSGAGTFSLSDVQLQWNYGRNGVNDGNVIDVMVYAIEMVYVPAGGFFIGDSATTSIRGNFRTSNVNKPYWVGTENAMTLGGSSGSYLTSGSGILTGDDFNSSTIKTVPAEFPKGYKAFYCMKYELSQQQWLDFYNTLTPAQKITLDVTDNDAAHKLSDGLRDRNNISWTGGAADATLIGGTNGCVAMEFTKWEDNSAYLDWSGLRPMTELEYEKACRGPQKPIPDEFAWGNTNISNVTGVTNGGAVNETATSGNCATNYRNNNSYLAGPVRVGSYAKSATTREQAGASYYGIMELSGNAYERVVSLGNTIGRAFAGTHGDGALATDGLHNVNTWPAVGGSNNGLGTGMRGGEWYDEWLRCRVSDRYLMNTTTATTTRVGCIRGVRSAL